MAFPNRRIVTGHDADGRSVVVADGPTPNLYGAPNDPILINFWATRSGNDDPALAPMALSPAHGGATFRFFRIHPERDYAHLPPAVREAQVAEYYAAVGSADAHVAGARHPGMHRTDSVTDRRAHV